MGPTDRGRGDILAGAAALTLALLSAAPGLAADLSVSPAQRELTASAGSVVQTSFRVRSVGADRKVFPKISDFDLDLDGNPAVGTDVGRSCAHWARLERNELPIRADEESELRVRLEPPAEASGAYWCLLTLEVQPEAPSRAQGNLIQIVPRVSVPILVSVGQAGAPRLTARFEQTERKADAISAWVVLENRGAAAAHLAGRVALEEAGSSSPTEVGTMVTEKLLLLPGHRRRIAVRIPLRGRAAVRLRAVFDYAAGQTLEVQSPAIP
jgi:hypothetical protein